MTNQKADFPSVPLKRYFTLEEMCALACLDTDSFLSWLARNGVIFGSGGQRYTRQDVFQLRQISAKIKQQLAQPKLEALQEQLQTLSTSVVEAREELFSLYQRMSNDTEQA